MLQFRITNETMAKQTRSHQIANANGRSELNSCGCLNELLRFTTHNLNGQKIRAVRIPMSLLVFFLGEPGGYHGSCHLIFVCELNCLVCLPNSILEHLQSHNVRDLYTVHSNQWITCSDLEHLLNLSFFLFFLKMDLSFSLPSRNHENSAKSVTLEICDFQAGVSRLPATGVSTQTLHLKLQQSGQ